MAMSGKTPLGRVLVTYKQIRPEIGEVETSLPLRMLVVGPYRGRQRDPKELLHREAIAVKDTNFDEVMASMNIVVEADVPRTLGGAASGDRLPVRIPIKDRKSFTPAAIASHVPELAHLSTIRQALARVKGLVARNRPFREAFVKALSDPNTRKAFAGASQPALPASPTT